MVLRVLITNEIPYFNAHPSAIGRLKAFLRVGTRALRVIMPIKVLSSCLCAEVRLLNEFRRGITPNFDRRLRAMFHPTLHAFNFCLCIQLTANRRGIVRGGLIGILYHVFYGLSRRLAVLKVKVTRHLRAIHLISNMNGSSNDLCSPIVRGFLDLLRNNIVRGRWVAVYFRVGLIRFRLL